MAAAGSPSRMIRPFSRSITRVQKLVRMFSSWDTNRMVLPLRRNSSILAKHFLWNLASPTASASSMMRISGSTLMATAKVRRHFMPLE